MSERETIDGGIDTLVNVGLAGAAADVVDRYGSGIKEHLVAHSGIDNETGQVLKRSLKGISQSKVNPEYRNANLKQQAGFAAETKEVARQRAEQAISGKRPTVTRTDDIPGHVNDPLYDITSEVDASGNPVPGASAQMKFIGSSPRAAVDKMLGKDFQKYIDNDCRMLVPSDYYDAMKEDLGKRIESLKEQVEVLKKQGKLDIAAQRQAQLEKCQKLNKNLEKSSVSNAEAMEARLHPGISTFEDVVHVAHRAGIEQAKIGAAFGGGISFVRNAIDYCKGNKTAKDAALDVVGDTTSAAALSYTTAFAGSMIKGGMQNSASSYVRTLSHTNLPALVATSTLEVGKTLKKFFQGSIDGVQCLEELGEKGYGMVNSALFAAVGQAAIPIPVVGAMAGSMIGYALSSASYHILLDSLKEANLARERRIQVEAECAEAVRMLTEYRIELEANIDRYMKGQRDFFDETFAQIKKALAIGDVDGYINAMNAITESCGEKPLFRNMEEFEALMASDRPIVF